MPQIVGILVLALEFSGLKILSMKEYWELNLTRVDQFEDFSSSLTGADSNFRKGVEVLTLDGERGTL